MMTLSAHHFQLVLLPPEHGFFQQHFVDGREIESAGEQFQQFVAVVGDAAAGAPKRERWPQDHREADLAAEVDAVFQIVDQRRFRHVEADGGHRVFEEQAVFGLLDRSKLRADELHVVLFKHAAIGQFNCEVQSGLSAHRRQERKYAGTAVRGQHLGFDADDLFQISAGERLDVGAVSHLRIGHDGGRVGVGQDHFVAFGLERLAGLRAGVVELGRLANDDGPGADDEHFRDVVAAWHELVLRHQQFV